MEDLIKRLEEASEGSRELDHAVHCYMVCGLNGPWGAYKSAADWQKWALKGNWNSPAYTTSLDAALTLVPEGSDWTLHRVNDGLTIWADVGPIKEAWGNTPALALCIAALRARAQEG